MESSIKCEIESREGKASANPNMLQLEPSEGDGTRNASDASARLERAEAGDRE
jgi:hypothetical protein